MNRRALVTIDSSAARDARGRLGRRFRSCIQRGEALLEPGELAVEQVPRGPGPRDVVVGPDGAEVLGDPPAHAAAEDVGELRGPRRLRGAGALHPPGP